MNNNLKYIFNRVEYCKTHPSAILTHHIRLKDQSSVFTIKDIHGKEVITLTIPCREFDEITEKIKSTIPLTIDINLFSFLFDLAANEHVIKLLNERLKVPFISGSCIGEKCSMCSEPATKKVEEHIFHDDPEQNRHGLTAYVCEKHFNRIMGVSPTRGDRFVEKTEQ